MKSVLLDLPTNTGDFVNRIEREKFADVVKAAIMADEHFSFDSTNAEGYVLRLQITVPSTSLPVRSVLLSGMLLNLAEEEITVFSDIKITDGQITGEDIKLGVKKLFENLYLALSNKPVDYDQYLQKIIQAVSNDTVLVGELINAIGVLGDVGEVRAVKPMMALMNKTHHVSVGNACLMALGDLKDPQAMSAIIEYVERKPPIFRRQAIASARKIASKEAAEWLLVMAYGHDDEIVREEAMEALFAVENHLAIVHEPESPSDAEHSKDNEQ